jgi:hypothetical protein
MSEAQEAWALWHLLQNFSDLLWNRYESAFLGFCIEAQEENHYCGSSPKESSANELPF